MLSQRWLHTCMYFSLEEQFGQAAAVWSEAYCSINSARVFVLLPQNSHLEKSARLV